MATPAFITFSVTVPSPSTDDVKAYFFLTKFATTDLSLFIITVVVLEVPLAEPDQFLNSYSAVGVAEIVATSPSLYCIPPFTVPPSDGFAEVAKVKMIGSFEHEKTSGINSNSRISFFIFIKVINSYQIGFEVVL